MLKKSGMVLFMIETVLFILEKILNMLGLMFRAWIQYFRFVVAILLVGIVIISIFRLFLRNYRNTVDAEHTKIKRSSAVLEEIVITILSTILVIWIMIVAAFAYKPEHVVVKHNQKMIAYVNSFLDVTVDYYPYKNVFVCGKESIGHEWYGSGSWDPFEQGETVEPLTSIFDCEGDK